VKVNWSQIRPIIVDYFENVWRIVYYVEN